MRFGGAEQEALLPESGEAWETGERGRCSSPVHFVRPMPQNLKDAYERFLRDNDEAVLAQRLRRCHVIHFPMTSSILRFIAFAIFVCSARPSASAGWSTWTTAK